MQKLFAQIFKESHLTVTNRHEVNSMRNVLYKRLLCYLIEIQGENHFSLDIRSFISFIMDLFSNRQGYKK